MEFKKSLRSGYGIICVATIFICFLLGYILTVSIDKVQHLSIEELYFSIYTVFTQFGMLIFSVIVIQAFYTDYRQKNILFYKLLGYGSIKYYLEKLILILFWLSVPMIIATVTIGVIYNNFNYIWIMIFYYECVLIFEVLITSMLGFLIKNMILGFVINLFCWLVSVILSATSEKLNFLAYYDASNSLYMNLNDYFLSGNADYLNMEGMCMYSLVLFLIVFTIVVIFRKRWEANGI